MKKEMIYWDYWVMGCCFVEVFCCIDISVRVVIVIQCIIIVNKDIDVSQMIIPHYDCELILVFISIL